MDGKNNGKGHVVVMDNYFSSVGLFGELVRNGTCCTKTLKTICIGIPQIPNNIKELNCSLQGMLVWRMHEFHGMASVSWKDKRPVILLSTHVVLIDMFGDSESYMTRRNGAIHDLMRTSPMHLEYTMYMREVDVANQLGASYLYQT